MRLIGSSAGGFMVRSLAQESPGSCMGSPMPFRARGRRIRSLTMAASALTAALVTLLSPVSASACAPLPGDHCYGKAEWNVEGKSKSGFKGLDAILGINSEALNAEEWDNIITDEAWVGFDGTAYWNESGEVLGCVAIIGCTPEHEDRFFWFQNSEKYGEGGAMSPEGNRGPGEWEVTDDYYAPTNGWYVKSGPLVGGVNGQPSWSPDIQVGAETTTASAIQSAGATNLDWEDLQGNWHYSNWSSSNGHARIVCYPPAAAIWDVAYWRVSYGVNENIPCGGESLVANAPAPAINGRAAAPMPELRPMALSVPNISPNLTATSEMAMPELKARVLAIAASVGDSNPSSIEVVKASRARAVAAVTPGLWLSETPEQQEWLKGSAYAVVVHGNFEAAGGSGATPENEPPSKPYVTLSIVIDARTGAVSTFELSDASQRQPALTGLGAVSAL
jgi:hypothetical protein